MISAALRFDQHHLGVSHSLWVLICAFHTKSQNVGCVIGAGGLKSSHQLGANCARLQHIIR